MKVFLSLVSLILVLSAFTFQAYAKGGHGPGKGRGKGHGHNKHYYKKPKHSCNGHCRRGAHYYYRERVIVQPAPRPGININIPL